MSDIYRMACDCSAADVCPLGKVGSATRCSASELRTPLIAAQAALADRDRRLREITRLANEAMIRPYSKTVLGRFKDIRTLSVSGGGT